MRRWIGGIVVALALAAVLPRMTTARVTDIAIGALFVLLLATGGLWVRYGMRIERQEQSRAAQQRMQQQRFNETLQHVRWLMRTRNRGVRR